MDVRRRHFMKIKRFPVRLDASFGVVLIFSCIYSFGILTTYTRCHRVYITLSIIIHIRAGVFRTTKCFLQSLGKFFTSFKMCDHNNNANI